MTEWNKVDIVECDDILRQGQGKQRDFDASLPPVTRWRWRCYRGLLGGGALKYTILGRSRAPRPCTLRIPEKSAASPKDGPAGGGGALFSDFKGPKRTQRGKNCPQYCPNSTKTCQESLNFNNRRHIYGCGWSLRQHINLKGRLGVPNGLTTLKKRSKWAQNGPAKGGSAPAGPFWSYF